MPSFFVKVPLREWLKVNDDRLIQSIQHGKSIANIGQIQGSEIHIGDRIYTGSDAETIKRVLFECGLIKDKLPGFQKVECKIPQTIYPVLVHAKYQQLVKEIIFHKWSRFSQSPPQIALRLQGLINQTWSFCNLNHQKKNDSLIIHAPTNPPVTVTSDDLSREFSTGVSLEILVDSRREWRQDITLQPITTTPTDINFVDALAAFVFPADPLVIELVRQARGKIDDLQPRLGFTNVSSVEAAEALYLQLCKNPRQNFWQSGFWQPGEVVRLPRKVLEEGEANCLDLALLFCSAIEHIRRLPVLVGVKISDSQWQVMAGVRVNDEDVNDSALCLDIKEIKQSCRPKRTYLFALEVLIDGENGEEAHNFAQKQLANAKKAFLVDIQAARNTGIWSLPISEPLKIQLNFSSQRIETPLYIEPSLGLPTKLAEEIAKGRAVFLLGDVLDSKAAISRQKFAQIMSQKAELEETDLLYASNLLIKQKINHEQLIQEAMSVLTSAPYQPTAPYQHLIQLPVKTIVSFHPDRVLEELLQNQHPPFRMLIDDEDLAALQPKQGSQELYLLGGSALTGKGLVLTHRDHHQLVHRINVMARGLRDRLALQTLVLLGCDLSDFNLKELYLEATKHLSYCLCPIYLVGCSHVDQWLSILKPCRERKDEPCKVLKQSPQELLSVLANIVPTVTRPVEITVVESKSRQKQRLPYKYLDYFEAEDADLFFGREEDLEQVSREIWASPGRILVLCGRSGVGKTSLIKAGLVPRLKQEGNILAVYTRFGKDPEQSIINVLQTHLEIKGERQQDSFSDLKQLLKEVFQERQREIVVFMDQSEEAFIKLGQQFLEQFFGLVRELVLDSTIGIRFVFALREDYLGRLAKYQGQLPRLLETVYPLQELTREAAREAIIKPAQKCSLKVEEALIEEILDDLSPDRILPAHLQIVCHRLYQECGGKGLTLGLYEQVGRAKYILKQHLEEAMGRLPADVEPVARKVLRSLVTSEQTKDLLSLEQIVKRTGLDEKQVAQAVHDLIHSQRLLRELDGDPIRFEFSHESLVDSVAEWLEATDLRIREVQEMLDQEVSNARKFEGFQFPLDKLRLIDEHREHLELESESIIVTSQAIWSTGELPNFWKEKLSEVGEEKYFKFHLGMRSIYSQDDLVAALVGKDSSFINKLIRFPFSKQMIELISHTLSNAPLAIIPALVNFAFLDSSRESEIVVFYGLKDASDEKAKYILDVWETSEKNILQPFQLIEEKNQLVSCKIISRLIQKFYNIVSLQEWFSLLIKFIEKELLYDCDAIIANIAQIECTSLSANEREKLTLSVIHGNENFIDILLHIAVQENSGQTLTSILKSLQKVNDIRANLIYGRILAIDLIYRKLNNVNAEILFITLINLLEKKWINYFEKFIQFTLNSHCCSVVLKSIIGDINFGYRYKKHILFFSKEPKVIEIVLKFLRRRKSRAIRGNLRKKCLELVKRVNSPLCANEVILALADHPKISRDVRDAIFIVLHSELETWVKDQPSISQLLIIVGSKLKKEDSREFRQIILNCLPIVQARVREMLTSTNFSKREKRFAKNILREFNETD